jgi:HD-GYP domain-containing protein (c-di-GMP phosphodiesterase class II)
VVSFLNDTASEMITPAAATVFDHHPECLGRFCCNRQGGNRDSLQDKKMSTVKSSSQSPASAAHRLTSAMLDHNDRWLRELFLGNRLEIKLFFGATVVGTGFALLLSALQLLTNAHLQHVDMTDRYALMRYAYTLSDQVHYDLLGMIFASFLIVYTITALLYPFVRLQQKTLRNLALDNMRARTESLITLGSTIAKRDSDTSTHNYRVTLYAIHLAEMLYIPKAAIPDLIIGAFLHDIGKIAIPDKILLKPGPLNEEEFRIMRTHVVQGLDIIHHSSFLRGAEIIVGGHHERYDGTGYPRGLSGKDIPPIARLFTIVDVFDALTSKRPYKPALPLDESLRLMAEESGKAFEPEYLQQFPIGARMP